MNDREKIKTELAKSMSKYPPDTIEGRVLNNEMDRVLRFIDTLQPRIVDLDFELNRVAKEKEFHINEKWFDLRKIARYFYELGRNNAI